MDEIQQALKIVVYGLYGVEPELDVVVAPGETGADYASNVAMKLAKLVHQNPMVVAEAIKAKLEEGSMMTDSGVENWRVPEKVEVARPGFLNFTLGEGYFVERALAFADGVELGLDTYAGKMVVAEFSDPNPFKVLHVGHLYTSIVGDSISRLMELAGARVVRANFGGDVGMHVAKTISAAIGRKYTPEDLTVERLAECYVEGTRAYDEDERMRREIAVINKEIYEINAEDLHGGELRDLYWRGRELSYEYFKDFYAQIGVTFDKFYPESSVAGRGLSEVRAHTGTVYEESEGAVVYHGEKVGLHTRVFINKEGVPTYEAKDVGLIFTKWDDWRFDESVVVTGNEQTEYMKVVLASVSEYAPELVERTTHLTHGLVKLAGNVKMSSRKGNFLRAVDVLEMVREMLGGDKADVKVVLAAIKYAFLKYKMGGDIVFDPKESVSTVGNSGVYILYSVVRAKKILEKGSDKVATKDDIADVNEFELRLCKKLVQYRDVVLVAVEDKAPNKVCTYLYELAQTFSRFYENVQVVGGEHEGRLRALVVAYANVMEDGLAVLGIEAPEEM